MNAQPRFDTELERRKLTRLKPETVSQVRDLCRHPQSGVEILHARLINGCRVPETEYRWQLFEALLCGWHCCQSALDDERERVEQAHIERMRTDPEYRAMRGQLAALNYRSGQAHLTHEQGKQAAPQVAPEKQRTAKQPMTVVGRTNPKWHCE